MWGGGERRNSLCVDDFGEGLVGQGIRKNCSVEKGNVFCM